MNLHPPITTHIPYAALFRSHPSTLSNRHLQASVLQTLGLYEGALVIIEDVVAKRTANADFGPDQIGNVSRRELEEIAVDAVSLNKNDEVLNEDVRENKKAKDHIGRE